MRKINGFTYVIDEGTDAEIKARDDAERAAYWADHDAHTAEAAAECYAEGAWLRAAEAPRFDPREDELEAMDEGLQWLRAQRDAS